MIYIPGYDPIPPRRYRELYRTEGAAQAAISGYDLALRPREAGGTYGWSVQAQIEGAEVEAEVDVLVWSDIVQSSMAQSIPATYLQLLRTAWIYISTCALRRLMRLRKGPVIAALYPVGMLLGQLALSVFTGWLAARALLWLMSLAGLGGLVFGWVSVGACAIPIPRCWPLLTRRSRGSARFAAGRSRSKARQATPPPI